MAWSSRPSLAQKLAMRSRYTSSPNPDSSSLERRT
jgi:hypothetical protein